MRGVVQSDMSIIPRCSALLPAVRNRSEPTSLSRTAVPMALLYALFSIPGSGWPGRMQPAACIPFNVPSNKVGAAAGRHDREVPVRQGGSHKTAPDAEVAGSDQPIPVTVTYIPTGSPRSVTIAGTFNGWNRGATHLTPQPGSLAWRVTLELPPGIYPYRLVVNGSRWLTPRDAPRWNDGNGNVNALLLVAPTGFAQSNPRVGDGSVTPSGVFHINNSTVPPSTVRPIRYVSRSDRGQFDLALRTRRSDVQSCEILTPSASRDPAPPIRIPMTRRAGDALFEYWSARIALPGGAVSAKYAFIVRDAQDERIYDSTGSLWNAGHSPRWFEVQAADFPPFETPDWVRDAIFYQIFPDRFGNGDPRNDPADVAPWGSPPTGSNRMGGDLAGVLDHMEYLRDLGINALYLNPVFMSRSNHGFDTTDYTQIDPRFGTAAELKSLTARAHLHGYHVILDGVFNHTGVDFAPFQSIVLEGRNSRYRSWYFVHGFPVQVQAGLMNYEGWNGLRSLPKLNVANKETRDYLLDVATYWVREARIDGWRLDAANEVSHDFWKVFRKSVKAVDPDALLLGEIWSEASEWLQGDEMDSVMNYPWRAATLDFFVVGRSSPSEFDARLERIRYDYAPAATAVMFNMLGSHDVERIATLCKGDWVKERQAVVFQMTYPGAPCVYYGDEIGMEGGKDPDNRRAMPWDETKWNQTSRAFYRAAIALRRRRAVLRRGDYRTLAADNQTGIYAYLRSYKAERALVVFNRSDHTSKVTIPIAKVGAGAWQTWLSAGATSTRNGAGITLTLQNRGFVVVGQ